MRIKILVVSALLLLAFFAINACSVNWDAPESQTVDQMFAGDSGTFSGVPPDGEYASPQAARAAEAGQDNKAILDTPVGGTLSSAATSPKEARSQDLDQINPTQPVVANTTAPVQPTAPSDRATSSNTTTSATTVSGTWSLVLNDSASRTADLTLFQSGDAVYGTGNINLDPTTTMIAAASGTIAGDKLNLDVVSLGKVSLYRISMTLSGDSATGSYITYSPGASSPISGTATGIRSGT